MILEKLMKRTIDLKAPSEKFPYYVTVTFFHIFLKNNLETVTKSCFNLSKSSF